jgi:hypothetical protein
MVGRQIRAGGLMKPFYTIVAVTSPTQIILDQPWAGPDVAGQSYQMFQAYYAVPQDFGYMYSMVSLKDGYRIWTNVTEDELNMLDPQRTNFGQTYVAAYLDYTVNYGGSIGPAIPVAATGASPTSTTTTGFSSPSNTTYIVQVTTTGVVGTATFQWMRAGQLAFTGPITTDTAPQDLADGVQVFWPSIATYNNGDLFVINATASNTTGVPRYEMWPPPTSSQYLYPYVYIKKVSEMTTQYPTLPAFVANRGDVLLEMALASCARYPGPDNETKNPYFSLPLADMHDKRAQQLIWDLEREDEEVGVSNITYQEYPMYPAPWMDGNWMQQHAPMFGM